MTLYLDTLLFTSNIVAPIFFIVFLGHLLIRLRVIDQGFVTTASRLVFTITLPALVFMSISRMDFKAVFNPVLLSYFIIGTLITFTLLWQISKRFIHRPEDLGVFIQGAFRGNYGIVGLAVSFNMFGDSGLAQASLLLACVIPLYNVLSVLALSMPHQKSGFNLSKPLLEIARNPLIIAVILALPFSYYGWGLPIIGNKIGNYFANLTLPLALLAIGGSLNLKSLRNTSGESGWATLIKLIIMPLVLTGGAWLYGFRGQDIGILMVLFGCPTAAASFIMAKGMGGNAQLAANIVLTTTLGSVLTLSGGIYLLRIWNVI
ncbi:AEC family transporter [Amphritea balenae]|uniref:AEC family transporter n=1 Tax=Amphritea balenae TaxID=452629 RepID=A0A3P1SR61_9GAMM|nr:AEC family transporter [Amphritea balenae]RRC99637.1 AEC family transporter [Amphritea balenae]GGK78582.1 transporter [Amphritea balenae]